eukprot:GHVU01106918.1.p2 GENE.GHVU01106918.1~~GHVU01106918.1.p2  ORF type:complete len:151 (-),score=28.13 GHVU01106918.1:513-965(-)
MGFVLDSLPLFERCVEPAQLFSGRDRMDWSSLATLLSEMPHPKLRRYYSCIVAKRLKRRIQQRLGHRGGEGEEAGPVEEEASDFPMPFEERYLTRDVIETYARYYGNLEAAQLERWLRDWDYEPHRVAAVNPRTGVSGANKPGARHLSRP